MRPRTAALTGFVAGLGFFLLLLRWLIVIGADAWVLLSAARGAVVRWPWSGIGTCLVVRLRGWPV